MVQGRLIPRNSAFRPIMRNCKSFLVLFSTCPLYDVLSAVLLFLHPVNLFYNSKSFRPVPLYSTAFLSNVPLFASMLQLDPGSDLFLY